MPRVSRAPAKAANQAAAPGKEAVRKAITAFILAFVIILSEAYCFTIRGDCELGFCLATMLTVEEYAELLLVGEFVTLKANGDSYTVQTSHDRIWNTFLESHNLFGPDNVAEATKSTGLARRRSQSILFTLERRRTARPQSHQGSSPWGSTLLTSSRIDASAPSSANFIWLSSRTSNPC